MSSHGIIPAAPFGVTYGQVQKIAAVNMTETSTRRLIDELRAVIADAEALVAPFAPAETEAGTPSEGRAEETLRRARAGLEQLEAQLGEVAKKLAEYADDYFREYPWPAVGIAAAVGICIGLLLNRR